MPTCFGSDYSIFSCIDKIRVPFALKLTILSLFQTDLQSRFSELRSLSSHRQHRLQESSDLFHFLREADEIEDWIKEKGAIATSDDYGRDLEHVEMLLKKFEDFTRDLMSSGERIASLTAEARGMLNEEHSDSQVWAHFYART